MIVLRRRRLRHRLLSVGALAACFFAGVASMAVWRGLERPAQPADGFVEHSGSAPVSAPEPASKSPSLLELEWRAFDSRDNRAVLFLEVAQRYLDEERDFDSALRCYKQALDAAPDEILAIRPDDNWLVMALKEARQKGEQ